MRIIGLAWKSEDPEWKVQDPELHRNLKLKLRYIWNLELGWI